MDDDVCILYMYLIIIHYLYTNGSLPKKKPTITYILTKLFYFLI